MEAHIAEKEKLSFIRSRWLLISMSPDIMKRYIRLPTARDIWKALSQAFYDGARNGNGTGRGRGSPSPAFSAKQSGRTLSVYYEELIEIFSELDHRDQMIMENEKDVASYHKSVQWLRMHIFLAGLDGEFEQIHGEILRKNPILTSEECYALVRHECVRRETMNAELGNSEASTIVIQNHYYWYNKSSYKCTRCNPSGHTKNRCYELVGYPEWWDYSRDSWKMNSKKTSTAAIVETKTENAIAEAFLALAAATEAHMLVSYWGHVLTSTTYLINRVLSSTIDFRTPSQALAETIVAPVTPNLSPYVFGCVAFVHLHKHQCTKLTPRALRCVFLRYVASQKGYHCYHPPTKCMFVTLDVIFHEDSMYFSSELELQGEYQE
ncbi:hypothetical protein CsSME_00006609 [Camellia sinensis var. sinensis]